GRLTKFKGRVASIAPGLSGVATAAVPQTTALAVTCTLLTSALGLSPAQADVGRGFFGYWVEGEEDSTNFDTFESFGTLTLPGTSTPVLSPDGETLDIGAVALNIGNEHGRDGRFMVSDGQRLVTTNGIAVRGGEFAVTGAGAIVETSGISVYSKPHRLGKLSIADGGVVRITGAQSEVVQLVFGLDLYCYNHNDSSRRPDADCAHETELEIDGEGSLLELTPPSSGHLGFLNSYADVQTATITISNGGMFRVREATGNYRVYVRCDPIPDSIACNPIYRNVSHEEANAGPYGAHPDGHLVFNIGAASGEAAVAAGFVDFHKPLPLAGTSQLVFNHTNTDYEFGAAISGTGSVLVENGTTILTGANTYTGGTTITGGTLHVAEGGSIAGNIINNSPNARGLVFAPSEALTYEGVISGTGNLTKEGPGRLTLTSANSYTGGTTVTTGTLRLADGGSVAGDMTVTGGTLQVDDGGSIDGATTVSGGALLVNSSLQGITLNDGGVLGGDGTVSGVSVNSGATLAPGNSIGTLNVDGDITLSAGSSYAVEVNRNGAADLLAVDGGVTIDQGAVVHVSAEHGTDTGFYYAPSTAYTILTADNGITGTFGGVTDSFAFLDSTLDYRTSNQVILVLERNLTSLADVAVTENQRNVAIAVGNLNASNDVLNAVMGLSADDARSAYDTLSGEIHPSVDGLLIQDSSLGRTAVNNRLRSAFDGVAPNEQQAIAQDRSGGSSMGWFEGYGQWNSISETDNTAALDSQTTGFVAGLDTNTLVDEWQIGLFAGYGSSSLSVDDREASGDVDSFVLGAYAGYQLNNFGFRFGASNAWHNVTSDRTLTVGGFSDELSADYAANTFQVFGEVGYTHTTQLARIEPFTGLALINQRTHDFVEEGGAATLSTGTSSQSVGVFSLGTRFERQLQIVGSDATLLNGSLGWHRALGDLDPVKTMRFNDSSVFEVAGAPVEENTFLVELGLRHQVDGVLFNLNYYNEFGDLAQNQGFSINASFRF
ncbi:autotransporter domain-containing protein, partial [Roseobacter sp. HKCCD9010]